MKRTSYDILKHNDAIRTQYLCVIQGEYEVFYWNTICFVLLPKSAKSSINKDS
jgi:hypothetical protein